MVGNTSAQVLNSTHDSIPKNIEANSLTRSDTKPRLKLSSFKKKLRLRFTFKFRRFWFLGHERSLTQIKFNREGDLLFSCSKDHVINVWYSDNGERLGTYDGHNGTVWTIDVDRA